MRLALRGTSVECKGQERVLIAKTVSGGKDCGTVVFGAYGTVQLK